MSDTTANSVYVTPEEEERQRVLAEMEDLENRFTYHPPKDNQGERYRYLRAQAHHFATEVLRNCPRSRERSLAFTKIEEAIMWANAAIARGE